ncbi:MAG: hypothetical protein WD852_05850 [Methyloceanibacter sp.]
MTARTRLNIATKRLERLTDDLETIADWRNDLAGRLRRAHLRFELIGLDPHDQEQLEAEAQAFLQVCRTMSASFTAPCAEQERRAA